MTGIDKIIDKILKDAQIEADQIVDKATDEALAIKAKAQEEADNKVSEILKKADSEVVEIQKRAVTYAKMRERQKKLETKQELIKTAYKMAVEQIGKSDTNQAVKFYSGLLKKASLKGDEEIILPTKFKEDFLNQLNKETGYSLKPSSHKATVANGFIIVMKDAYINYSIDALLEYRKEELEQEVINVLF